MINRIDVQPNDRFLLLSIPEPSFLAELAALLPAGLIVGLGAGEEVREARREARDLDNVMLVPAAPDDIPWRDSFFTKAVDAAGRWPPSGKTSAELARVLAPGASVYLAGPPSARDPLLAAGFRLVSSDETMLIVVRSG